MYCCVVVCNGVIIHVMVYCSVLVCYGGIIHVMVYCSVLVCYGGIIHVMVYCSVLVLDLLPAVHCLLCLLCPTWGESKSQ